MATSCAARVFGIAMRLETRLNEWEGERLADILNNSQPDLNSANALPKALEEQAAEKPPSKRNFAKKARKIDLSTVSNTFEFISIFLVLSIVFSASFLSRVATGRNPILVPLDMLGDTNVIFGFLLVFSEIFAVTLTGRTIFLSLLESKSGATSGDEWSPSILPSVESAAIPGYTEFVNFIERSAETFRRAQRRPNALLLVGTSVAVLGLVFFILTLPGSLFSPEDKTVTLQDFYKQLFDLVPRLLMLIFIQVLAGFFLRQYRLSMEELRYFESLLRARETQLLSFRILAESQFGPKLQEFASQLVTTQDRDTLKLQSGETTVMLEVQKIEGNEFSAIYDKAFDLLSTATSKNSGDKPGAAAV